MKIMIFIITLLFTFTSVYAHDGNETYCSATVTSEESGYQYFIYVDIQIMGKNETDSLVDTISWIMKSDSGKVLMSESWYGPQVNKYSATFVGPDRNGVWVDITPIHPGDTVNLVRGIETMGWILNSYLEHTMVNANFPEAATKDHLDLYRELLRKTENKYTDITCEIVGFKKTK